MFVSDYERGAYHKVDIHTTDGSIGGGIGSN